ncbi:MAG: DNA repair protein RecO, partial [Candidatus Limnocylindrus sp.]
YAAELVERATSDEQPEPALYALLLRSWDLLESGVSDHLVARWIELALLDAAGHAPELDHCVECGRPPVEGEALRWDEHAGGIHCATPWSTKNPPPDGEWPTGSWLRQNVRPCNLT